MVIDIAHPRSLMSDLYSYSDEEPDRLFLVVKFSPRNLTSNCLFFFIDSAVPDAKSIHLPTGQYTVESVYFDVIRMKPYFTVNNDDAIRIKEMALDRIKNGK